jgi:hypothetical protein
MAGAQRAATSEQDYLVETDVEVAKITSICQNANPTDDECQTCLRQVVLPPDTNPDAAVAEAAQEAIQEPVHGQPGDDKQSQSAVLQEAIDSRMRAILAAIRELEDKLADVTKERDEIRDKNAELVSALQRCQESH